MKKALLFVVLATFLAIGSFAQIRPIPASVTDAFTSRYPHATNIAWKDRINTFEANFDINGTNISADFLPDGEWQSSETKTGYDNLPDAVKDGFTKSRYSDWTKGDVTEVERMGKPVHYKVYVEKSSPFQKRNLFFSADGKLTREAVTL